MLIRNVKESDWQAIHQIEATNFSKEEAISKEAIQERIKCIPDTFLVAEIND
ncbi:GNAT family N-acetyltransferase, partial [Streptococcus iniae]